MILPVACEYPNPAEANAGESRVIPRGKQKRKKSAECNDLRRDAYKISDAFIAGQMK